jgi:hypothetical protein
LIILPKNQKHSVLIGQIQYTYDHDNRTNLAFERTNFDFFKISSFIIFHAKIIYLLSSFANQGELGSEQSHLLRVDSRINEIKFLLKLNPEFWIRKIQ